MKGEGGGSSRRGDHLKSAIILEMTRKSQTLTQVVSVSEAHSRDKLVSLSRRASGLLICDHRTMYMAPDRNMCMVAAGELDARATPYSLGVLEATVWEGRPHPATLRSPRAACLSWREGC